MDVAELLRRIQAAYPGATPDAMKTFVPVYYARLRDREGEPLATAATEVFGSFRPKSTQPFPIPADFEAHLPSKMLKLPSGPRIDLAAHRERKTAIVDRWWQQQGEGIRTHRGKAIASACAWMATSKAEMLAWETGETKPVILSAAEIQVCEDRVVSSERMLAHRAYSLRGDSVERWKGEMESCRAMVRAGKSPLDEMKAAEESRKADAA